MLVECCCMSGSRGGKSPLALFCRTGWKFGKKMAVPKLAPIRLGQLCVLSCVIWSIAATQTHEVCLLTGYGRAVDVVPYGRGWPVFFETGKKRISRNGDVTYDRTQSLQGLLIDFATACVLVASAMSIVNRLRAAKFNLRALFLTIFVVAVCIQLYRWEVDLYRWYARATNEVNAYGIPFARRTAWIRSAPLTVAIAASVWCASSALSRATHWLGRIPRRRAVGKGRPAAGFTEAGGW